MSQTTGGKPEKQRGNRPEHAGQQKQNKRERRQQSRLVQELQDQLAELKTATANIKEDVKVDERELKIHPWNLKGKYMVHDNGKAYTVYCGDRFGTFPTLTVNDVYELDKTYPYLARVCEAREGIAIPITWSQPKMIEDACKAVMHLAIGKTDMELRLLVPHALNALRNLTTPWPGAELEITDCLLSVSFADAVARQQEAKALLAPNLEEARIIRDMANNGERYSRQEIRAALNFNVGKLIMITLLCFLLAAGAWRIRLLHLVFWPVLIVVIVNYYRFYSLVFRIRTLDYHVHYASIISIVDSCTKHCGFILPAIIAGFRTGIGQAAKFVEVQFNQGNWDEQCRRKQPYNVYGTNIFGASMVIPAGCHHDQAYGSAVRFLFEREYDLYSVKSVIDHATDFTKFISMDGVWVRYTDEEWLNHLKGKRAALLRAADDIFDKDIRLAVPVDMFCKMEAYLGKAPSSFKPRIIQGRKLEYQKILGSYFYSVSKWLATIFNKDSRWTYDSGMTAEELGSRAAYLFATYKNVYEIDVSNWDGSLLPEWLQFERQLIGSFPELPPQWKSLRKYWTNVESYGKKGVSFKTCHGRRSGDLWTSCFNSLINICIVTWIAPDANVVAKGDDNFFGTNSNLTTAEIELKYASIGMVAKVKKVVDISQLSYCSGGFYPVAAGYKWGVKPFRIIAKLGLNLHRHPVKVHDRLLFGIALSLLPIAGHVPFIGTLLRSIITACQNRGIAPIYPEEEEWKATSLTIDDIHPLAYNEIAARVGLSIEDIDIMNSMVTERDGRPLELTDFPLVLKGDGWLRGFVSDVDAKFQDMYSDNVQYDFTTSGSEIKYTWMDLHNMFLAPIYEEVLRSLYPSFHIFIILFEGMANSYLHNLLTGMISVLLHLFLGYVNMNITPLLAIIIHMCWNVYVVRRDNQRITLITDEEVQGLREPARMLVIQRGGVFTPIPNCVPRKI